MSNNNKPIIVECVHHGKFTYYPGTQDYKHYYPIVHGFSILPLTCRAWDDDNNHPCNDEMIVVSK